MHSWSSNGNIWSGCCFSDPVADGMCMWEKPAQLTKNWGEGAYVGAGFEISSLGCHSIYCAIDAWKRSYYHDQVLLSDKFNAMGCAHTGGGKHTVVWFGREEDAYGYDGCLPRLPSIPNDAEPMDLHRCFVDVGENTLPPLRNTLAPTIYPTRRPTRIPTHLPTLYPTHLPTHLPTLRPTHLPTHLPTIRPTHLPTLYPTHLPTHLPTLRPTHLPTHFPTNLPTHLPTIHPTVTPAPVPTSQSHLPTAHPLPAPTARPTSIHPSASQNDTAAPQEDGQTDKIKHPVLNVGTLILLAVVATVLFIVIMACLHYRLRTPANNNSTRRRRGAQQGNNIPMHRV